MAWGKSVREADDDVVELVGEEVAEVVVDERLE